MADACVTFSTKLDNESLEKDLSKLTKKIEKSEENIARVREKLSQNKETSLFKSAELDAEKAKLQEIKDRLQDIRELSKDKSRPLETREVYSAQIPAVQQELSDQKTRVRMLQSEYNRVTGSAERYEQKLTEATAELNRQKAKAGELAARIEKTSSSSKHMGTAIRSAGKYMDAFLSRVKRLAGRVFIFSVITRAFRALLGWMWKMIQTDKDAARAFAQLKAALVTLAQPILNVVIPAFTLLVKLLTRIITVVSKLFAWIFGYSHNDMKKQAEALNKEAAAIGSVGDAAKEASKYLAGFDELNTLPAESEGNSGVGGIGGGGGMEPDFNFDTGFITDKLDEIVVYVAGSLLALGAILAFSGANIPLGIALMALGAVILAAEIKENWNAMDEGVGQAITRVMVILGGAALVIGAILTFSGADLPIGIGLMVAGAAMLGGAAALNWDTVQESLQGPIGGITALVCGALIVVGAILAFTGVALPLGIGLIAVGAAGLVAVAALNLTDRSFEIFSGGGAVVQVTEENGLWVNGKITATSGTIGGFDILEDYLSYNGQTWGGTNTTGGYFGINGLQLGPKDGGFNVDMHGNMHAENGTFNGYVKAKRIEYGGDAGTFDGDGISSHSISGGRLQFGTVSTSYTSDSINTSLGYADYANSCLNGWQTIPNASISNLSATEAFKFKNRSIDIATMQVTTPNGPRTISYLGWQS